MRMTHAAVVAVLLCLSAPSAPADAGTHRTPATALDVELCARTAWGEARNQPRWVQAWIIHTIANRWLHPSARWGRSIEQVALAPRQFSPWLPTDANYAVVTDPRLDRRKGFRRLKVACALILDGRRVGDMPDPTKGALWFHSGARPYWAINQRGTRAGAFTFYQRARLAVEPTPPRGDPIGDLIRAIEAEDRAALALASAK